MAVIKINDLNSVEHESNQVNNNLLVNVDNKEITSIMGGNITIIVAPTIVPVIIFGSNNYVNVLSYFNNQNGNNFNAQMFGSIFSESNISIG